MKTPSPSLHASSPLWPCLFALLLLPSAAAAQQTVWVEPASGIEFIKIDGNCFDMGVRAPGPTDDGMPIPMPRADEVPLHRVCVDAFWMARTETTEEQWQRIMAPGAPPPLFPERPRTDISWHEARNFVERLNAAAVKEPAHGGRFRLPTEAEWESACHAGQPREAVQQHGAERARLAEELGAFAWYSQPSLRDPHAQPVGRKSANGWGLHDMLGNVWEWTEDAYLEDAYSRHTAKNPRVAGGSGRRVIRGGSYKSDLALVRCGVRNHSPEDDRTPTIGMRILREYRRN